MKVLLINQPDDYYSLLDVRISDHLCKKNEIPEIVHLFYKTEKEFETAFKKLKSVCKKKQQLLSGFPAIKNQQRFPLMSHKILFVTMRYKMIW